MRIRRRSGRLDCRLAQATAVPARPAISRAATLCAAMTLVVLPLLAIALCGPLCPLWAEDAEPPVDAPTVDAPHEYAPHLLLSEVMVAPLAVNDENGEWIEALNTGPEPVNLRSYVLQTNAQRHVIEQDVWLAAGGRALLARGGDPAQNGGVTPDYVYADLLLGNESDSLALLAPDEVTLDRVAWGEGAGLAAPLGASLERQGDDAGAAWTAAWSRWPASAGDLGSPGAAYAPPPAPSETATASPAPAATPTLMPTVLPTAPPAAPRLWLSEVMANPAAAPDEAGEWLELYNGDAAAVNLQGWTLADLGSDRTSIAAEVWLQPGEYAVLGRSADVAANGGLAVRFVYAGLQLANEADELILLAPWGEEVDRVAWGEGTGLSVSQGASLERSEFAPGAAWVTAAQSWPGSWGDLGSPNLPYVPRAPAPPTAEPTLAPTPLALPPAWEPATESAALAIDEVYYRSADDEYIVLANVGDADVDLSGWSIGDAEMPGDAEGVYALPDGRRLAPGQLFVIARNAQAFRARWGRGPDAEIEESDAQIPTLSKRAGWASGVLALNDGGDEVILLDPAFRVADAVAYGDGALVALHLEGALHAASGQSLQRVPGFRYPAVAEQRHRFLAAVPQPFEVRALPVPQARARPALGDGLTALWGTLGASSNFSTGGTAPPHFVAAAAAAEGLHFVALADPAPAHGDEVLAAAQGALINLPAWQWRNADGAAGRDLWRKQRRTWHVGGSGRLLGGQSLCGAGAGGGAAGAARAGGSGGRRRRRAGRVDAAHAQLARGRARSAARRQRAAAHRRLHALRRALIRA